MDFLDPRKKRTHKIRLMMGYVLMATVIGLAVYLLVSIAGGYGINPKTGQVVVNGLLFVDSKPGGAKVQLSGASSHQTTTSARLNLPAGNYILKLSKAGYRDWQRSITLNEHAIARYVYPFLFPLQPLTTTMSTYKAPPPLVTESLDYHWLLLQTDATSTNMLNFEEYDTTKPAQAPTVLSLPNSVLADATLAGGNLTVVEWSSDNNHLLLKHTYKGGTEFIILDRKNPATSINVNKMFKINPSQVALRNKSVSQLYVYDKTAQTLRVGDTNKETLDAVFLKHVLAFKAYGSNLLTYVTDNNMAVGQVQARIWDNGPTHLLNTFTAGTTYLIDAGQFGGHWYYIAGSNTSDRINLFEDPLNDIKNPAIGKAIPILALRVFGANNVSFSANKRFVGVEAGQNFGVYDFETQTRYQYTIKAPLSGPLHWMDGHRLIGQSKDMVFVTDYDGTNQQSLTPTVESDGGYFSADFNHLFTLAPITHSKSAHLENVDMRAGSDLPSTQ